MLSIVGGLLVFFHVVLHDVLVVFISLSVSETARLEVIMRFIQLAMTMNHSSILPYCLRFGKILFILLPGKLHRFPIYLS